MRTEYFNSVDCFEPHNLDINSGKKVAYHRAIWLVCERLLNLIGQKCEQPTKSAFYYENQMVLILHSLTNLALKSSGKGYDFLNQLEIRVF